MLSTKPLVLSLLLIHHVLVSAQVRGNNNDNDDDDDDGYQNDDDDSSGDTDLSTQTHTVIDDLYNAAGNAYQESVPEATYLDARRHSHRDQNRLHCGAGFPDHLALPYTYSNVPYERNPRLLCSTFGLVRMLHEDLSPRNMGCLCVDPGAPPSTRGGGSGSSSSSSSRKRKMRWSMECWPPPLSDPYLYANRPLREWCLEHCECEAEAEEEEEEQPATEPKRGRRRHRMKRKKKGDGALEYLGKISVYRDQDGKPIFKHFPKGGSERQERQEVARSRVWPHDHCFPPGGDGL